MSEQIKGQNTEKFKLVKHRFRAEFYNNLDGNKIYWNLIKLLKLASKKEKQYIVKRAKEFKNAKVAALDVKINDLLDSFSENELA